MHAAASHDTEPILQPHHAIQVLHPPPVDDDSHRRSWIGLVVALAILLCTGYFAVQSRASAGMDTPDKTREFANVAETLRLAPDQDGVGTATPGHSTEAEDRLETAITAKALPFVYRGSTRNMGRAVECLAMAAWYEAGNVADDQRAVMQVVLNRVAHSAFPNSVCGVVFEGSHLATGCQFTFTCDGSLQRRKALPAEMLRARTRALDALEGATFNAVAQATHYHADYVRPWWSSALLRQTKVGRHIFYRMPGGRSALAANLDALDFEPDLGSLLEGAHKLTPEDLDQGLELSADELAPRIIAEPLDLSSPRQFPVEKPAALSRAILLQLDMASPNGRWAVSALDRCAGMKDCQVLGYSDASVLASNRARLGARRDRPLFLFLRDSASGMEVALWDCQRVQRTSESQCLPQAGPQLNRLLAERES